MCTINWQITGRLIRRLAVRTRSHGESKKYEVLKATYGSFVVYNTKSFRLRYVHVFKEKYYRDVAQCLERSNERPTVKLRSSLLTR